MTAQTILPANSAASGGFDVDNSCRFDRASTTKMAKTFGTVSTAAQRRKLTLSMWIKPSNVSDNQWLFCHDTGNASSDFTFKFEGQALRFYDYPGSDQMKKKTSRLFRDASAWYHVMLIIDTTLGTAADRVQIYVNGVRETSFSESTNPSQNDSFFAFSDADRPTVIGARGSNNSDYLSGYLAEYHCIVGTAKAHTDFGEFDEDSGIWKPIEYTGGDYSSNGFYLDFADSGNLGDDESGNENDFTETNLAAVDQTTDTCTNNFATINPNDNFFAVAVLAEGNTRVTTNAGAEAMSTGTFALSAGRWYFEVDIIARGSTAQVGITPHGSKVMSGISGKAGDVTPHARAYLNTGKVQEGDGSGGQTDLATLSSFTTGDIIGVYVDLEDMEFYVSKNGTLQNSGTGLTIAALDANEHDVSGGSGHYLAYVGDNTSGTAAQMEVNFGNPHQALSTAVSDDNGFGAFEYSPNITGDSVAKKFYAICTKNLAEFG